MKKALCGWAALARTLAIQAVALVAAHLSASAGPGDVAAAHAGALLNAAAIAMTLANATWTLRLLINDRRARRKGGRFL